MSDRIRVLQLGFRDWSELYRLPPHIQFTYVDIFEEAPSKPYDIVFIDRWLFEEELEPLWKATKAYCLFLTEEAEAEVTEEVQDYFECKKGKHLDKADVQDFLLKEVRNYFSGHYGEKYNLNNIAIAQGFDGNVKWDGNHSVIVNGDYGEEFNQIIYWRSNIPLFHGQAIEFWLEYQKDKSVEIEFSVTQFVRGNLDAIQQKKIYTESDLKDVVVFECAKAEGTIFVSLQAKGCGELKVIALHDRYSRRGHGYFIPGGERYVTSDREEMFCYFEPGDRKPPLNVYFSGYKMKQGFEGYNLMRKMGSPFLLIAEPRLEGGSFYMGTEEYEAMIVLAIRKYMDELNFSGEQVVMAGVSMGTFGAMYYGCDIKPHAMLVGKPLISIGNVALNERLHRPGGFPTSLDVLHTICGDTDEAAIQNLNDKFWNKFDSTDWGKSKFVVSYMIEDDYDSDAYDMLISHLKSAGAQVYGKGIHGRHNDETGAIVSWFVNQFEKILDEDFGRRIKK